MSSASDASSEWSGSAYLSSMAILVYRVEAMVDFYQEAFGIVFTEKRVGDLTAYFGVLDGIVFKLVPLAGERDADEFPTHQLGFEVEDVDVTCELALKYGGSILQEPIQRLDQLHAAIRDPDGNSIELYGPVPVE